MTSNGRPPTIRQLSANSIDGGTLSWGGPPPANSRGVWGGGGRRRVGGGAAEPTPGGIFR